VARPPKHPVDVKLKIVLSVLAGESTQAEAARRHGVSETSIGKWKEQFLAAGRQGLEHGDRAGKPTGQQARLVEEIDDLTRGRWVRRTSSCAPSSAAAPRAWGFAELEALRVEHDMTIAGFCRIVGLPARTYYDRRARHAAGQTVVGKAPTGVRTSPATEVYRRLIVERRESAWPVTVSPLLDWRRFRAVRLRHLFVVH
jgi:transposase